jgi:hypothetical protein
MIHHRTNVANQFFTFIGEIALILWDAVRRMFSRPREVGEVINQMSYWPSILRNFW